MIERVDILTGGASAVYGSDAAGGRRQLHHEVTSRVSKSLPSTTSTWHENDFGGPGEDKLRATSSPANASATNPSEFALPKNSVTDGEGKELSLMVGVNSGDGRGNITAYATVYDGDAILESRMRPHPACSLNLVKPGGLIHSSAADHRRTPAADSPTSWIPATPLPTISRPIPRPRSATTTRTRTSTTSAR